MRLAGLDAVGDPLGVTSDAALILQPDNTSAVSGTGFRPGTNVQVYIYSTPRLLGTVSTDANGNFAGTVPIPTDLELGRHTLQVNGFTADGQVRSLSMGVVLQAPQVTARQKVAKATVFFGPSSAQLTSKAKATLQSLARTVGSNARGGLVVGYVQRDKNLANNAALSTKRAKAIASHLRALGVKASLATRGDGALTSKDKSRKATVSITYTR
jgi:outer membrane protein OmpA-like peptidoglycan-associated protein